VSRESVSSLNINAFNYKAHIHSQMVVFSSHQTVKRMAFVLSLFTHASTCIITIPVVLARQRQFDTRNKLSAILFRTHRDNRPTPRLWNNDDVI